MSVVFVTGLENCMHASFPTSSMDFYYYYSQGSEDSLTNIVYIFYLLLPSSSEYDM